MTLLSRKKYALTLLYCGIYAVQVHSLVILRRGPLVQKEVSLEIPA
jgi:hypothetical protein